MKTTKKIKRRTMKYIKIKKNKKDYKTKQKFKNPHRKKIDPEKLGNCDYQIDIHINNIREIMNRFSVIFPDTNIIECPGCYREQSQLFQDYALAVTRYDSPEFKKPLEKIYNRMLKWIKFQEELFSNRDIYIIPEIKTEIKKYLNLTKDSIKTNIPPKRRSRFLKPLYKVNELIEESQKKVVKAGMEEDPLTDRIYNLLSKEHAYSRTLISKPDRKLVAFAISSGFTNGEDRAILSNDRHIKHCVIRFGEKLKNNHDSVKNFVETS